jgi:hypothetical protein
MISRPMHAAPPLPYLGHSDAPLQPQPWQFTHGPHGGYPAPVRRTKSFSFGPRNLPPVNLVRGGPRLYG